MPAMHALHAVRSVTLATAALLCATGLLCSLFAAPVVASIGAEAIPRVIEVRGYTRKDGTQVRPSVRTAPDGRRFNNFSNRKRGAK
jgi:hypothetical protein